MVKFGCRDVTGKVWWGENGVKGTFDGSGGEIRQEGRITEVDTARCDDSCVVESHRVQNLLFADPAREELFVGDEGLKCGWEVR